MPVSDFSDMFIETVTHEEFASRSDYGGASYGSAVSYSARVVKKAKLVKAADGSEVVATTQVWIQGAPAIDAQDRITLPDSSTPAILMVERYPDQDGDHHTKVFMG